VVYLLGGAGRLSSIPADWPGMIKKEETECAQGGREMLPVDSCRSLAVLPCYQV